MMIKVTLLGNGKVQDTLETEDNEQHCDGVRHVKTVLDELRGYNELFIDSFYHYGDKYAIGIKKENGVVTYISPKWVSVMGVPNGETYNNLTSSCKQFGTYIEFKRGYVINEVDMTITEKASLPICDCGAIISDDPRLKALRKCEACYVDTHFDVHNYSFKPTPEFTGEQIASNAGNEVWYGLELEYGLNSKLGLCKVVEQHKVYLKSDSSIRTGTAGGAEMVTHPHSFTELMSDRSFINKLPDIDCNENERNGCHIHVGRTAWVDDKHFALTYFLMYELATMGVLEKIGGRRFTNYCELHEPTERIHQVKKDKVPHSKQRSLWLNENNDATVEFRFFAGTNKADQVKRYIQLLEAVIKYTKFHKKTVTTAGLVAYINKHEAKYPQLVSFINTLTISDRTVTYTEPRQKVVEFGRLSILETTFISRVKLKNGTEYNDVHNSRVEGNKLYFVSGGNGYEFRFSEVDEVTVEV